MERGKRYAVCEKTYRLYQKPRYGGMFEFVDPVIEIPLDQAGTFDCESTRERHPRETKGQDYNLTTDSGDCCGPADSNGSNGGSSCC